MKKTLFLTVVLALTLLLCAAAPALAAPSLDISDAAGQIGQEVTVDVTLSDNPGCTFIGFGLVYDNACLQPVKMETGSAFSGGYSGSGLNARSSEGQGMISFTSLFGNAKEGDGIVATATFKIVGHGSGRAALSLERFNTNPWFRDGDGEILTPSVSGGSVAISGGNPILATSLTLNQTSLELDPGETAQLTATLLPAEATNTAVNWVSSNPAVATVVGGNVRALAGGATVITARSADGNASAACSVTVVAPVVKVSGISLDRTSLRLKPGDDPVQLTATVRPEDATNPAITWSSSKTAVATVKDGLVTPRGNGSATITATTVDGGLTAACSVIVHQPVSGVSLNATALQLNVGATATLIASVEPGTAADHSVSWASSDDSVVSVVNGLLTAVSAGKATITVTTSDSGKEAHCQVTVSEPLPAAIAVSGVKLDESSLTLEIGDSAQLEATITPDDATNQELTWSSSDREVVKVSRSGEITAVGSGSARVYVTTVDGGFTASCRVRVAGGEPLASLDYFQLSALPFPFTDVAVVPGDWVYEGVYTAYRLGLMRGVTDTTFAPLGLYKVSEALMTAARLHHIYSGGDGVIQQPAVWYQAAVDYCLENGIIAANDFDNYDRYITRGEMAYVYANALPAEELPAINSVAALPDVAADHLYAAPIFRLYNAGVLTGNDEFGTYYPSNNITRREAAAIISRMALSGERRSFVLQ